MKKKCRIRDVNYSAPHIIGAPLVRICNPHALNISICNATIGLKILISYTSGLQIPMSAQEC